MTDSNSVYFGKADFTGNYQSLNIYQYFRSQFTPEIIDSLFREAKIHSLSDDKKDKFLEKFLQVLEKRMAIKTWSCIPPDIREKIMKISETDQEAAQLEVLKSIPNLPELYKQEALLIRKEFIHLMKV